MQTRSFPVPRMRQLAPAIIFAIAGLAGCAWEPDTRTPQTRSTTPVVPARTVRPPVSLAVPPRTVRKRAANLAKRLIGTPYQWGGASPQGFDCSGLIHYVYAQSDVALPRTAAGQQRIVRIIPLRNAQPGDLLFFDLRTKSDHVAIYMGDETFIHAPSSGKTVQRLRLDNPYFSRRLSAVGRVSLNPSSP